MDPRLPRRAIGSVGGSPVLSITPDARTDETLLAVEIAKWMRVELSGSESRLALSAAESGLALQASIDDAVIRVNQLDGAQAARFAKLHLQLELATRERHDLHLRLNAICVQLADIERGTISGILRRLWRTLRG